jgi:phosphate/sulfate permease
VNGEAKAPTIRNIVATWVTTLPVAIVLAATIAAVIHFVTR